MGAPSKRARRVRRAQEFDLARLAPKKDRQSKVTMLRPWYIDHKAAS